MSDHGGRDFSGRGKRKVKMEELEDGPSSWPSQVSSFDKTDGDFAGGGDNYEEIGDSLDPLAVFGSGIMLIILSKLDALSVAQARLVCRDWLDIASSDKIWLSKCQELWSGKAHIPRISKAGGIPSVSAYLLSVMDGGRVRITQQDLCDHAWMFHFNEAAPEYWRNLDPYWTGDGNLMRRYFLPDGSVFADPDDRVWGGHESCYTVVTGVFEGGKIRNHYVRINRWAKLSVQRKPDWSWELSNHLCTYNSVPDAADKEEGTGPFYPLL